MDVEEQLRRAREDEARTDSDRTEAARAARKKAAGPLAIAVGVAFVGGLAYASYLLWRGGGMTMWMCFGVLAIAIPVAIVRSVVKALTRRVSDRW